MQKGESGGRQFLETPCVLWVLLPCLNSIKGSFSSVLQFNKKTFNETVLSVDTCSPQWGDPLEDMTPKKSHRHERHWPVPAGQIEQEVIAVLHILRYLVLHGQMCMSVLWTQFAPNVRRSISLGLSEIPRTDDFWRDRHWQTESNSLISQAETMVINELVHPQLQGNYRWKFPPWGESPKN